MKNQIRAQLEGGAASPRLSQAPTDYEQARVGEIRNRAALYQLRISTLKATLLDRDEVVREFGAMLSAIRTVINQSRLTKAEKEDVLRNLVSAKQFVENVTRQQEESHKPDEQLASQAFIERGK